MPITYQYESLATLRERAKEEVGKVVVGQGRAVELLLIAAMARGHVLLEGPPGTAKTLLGRATAYVLGADFNRVQFTPDTTPTELVGENITRAGETKFVSGTIFTNVLLADEINRTPPRTQAALLEAMAERSVTIEGRVHRLPDPFLVIATQNPFEQEGVFPLPESNLDRFLFKIYIDYTDLEHEVDMLRLPHTGVTPDMLGEIMPLLGIVGLDKARIELDATIVPEEVARYVVGVVRKTRVLEGVMLGASSRAAIHLMSATKANARLEGRDTVTIDDVRTMAQYVLPHRLIIEDDDVSPAEALQYALDNPILSELGSGPGPLPGSEAQAPSACSSARRVMTCARCARYSDEPAWSLGGSVPSVTCPAASAGVEPPASASSAAFARSGVAPMFTRPIEAPATEPLSRCTSAATPTVAQSCARRFALR